ncbi:hypothetical protein FRB91_007917 [Serendipita sp. 411]|nr:hypothetical protein FRB91_007917 [Serendipita sp. 411]
MVDDISARGQIVLNELRLLVSLSTEAPCLRSVATNMVGDSQVSEVSLVEPKQHQVYSSTSINFPRTSTQSSTKGRRIRSKSSAKSPDEKLINSRTQCNSNNLGIAKTVRRTLSGGISNIILRPFQPPQQQQQQHLPPPPPLVVKVRSPRFSLFGSLVSSPLIGMRACASRHARACFRFYSHIVSAGIKYPEISYISNGRFSPPVLFRHSQPCRRRLRNQKPQLDHQHRHLPNPNPSVRMNGKTISTTKTVCGKLDVKFLQRSRAPSVGMKTSKWSTVILRPRPRGSNRRRHIAHRAIIPTSGSRRGNPCALEIRLFRCLNTSQHAVEEKRRPLSVTARRTWYL